MDCRTARYLLDFARPFAHDLDAVDRAALDAHLAVCTDCDCVARAERQLDEHVGREIQDVPIPNGLKDRLLTKLHRQRDDRRKQLLFRGLRYVAAAAVVIALVSTWLFWKDPWSPTNDDLIT